MSVPHRLPALLALFLSAGCDAHVVERWPETGERRFTGRVQRAAGERHSFGFWTFWYTDGESRQAQGWFESGGVPDGSTTASGGTRVPREGRTKLWTFWHPDGTLLAEGKFADSLRDDLWACWREDGELCCSGTFANGLPDGFHATWRDGARRDEHHYAGGLLDGPRVVRDAAGQALWTGEYRGGTLVRAEPAGAPEPPLHLLEACAEAAEEGLRRPLDGPATQATQPADSPGG